MMKKTGFTLIEVIVSAVLTALILTGLIGVFIAGKTHLMHARSRMASSEAIESFLNNLHMQVNMSQWGSNCLGANNCLSSEVPSNITLNNITYNVNYTTSNVTGTSLRKANVTITWNEPGS